MIVALAASHVATQYGAFHHGVARPSRLPHGRAKALRDTKLKTAL